jgi:hypothetical protein
MSVFAVLDPTNTVFQLAPANPGGGLVAVDVTNVAPQPQVGWTYDGTNWTAPAAGSPLGNQQALLAKAAVAVSNNLAFLGLNAPSFPLNNAAQQALVAQVVALTRQVDALILLATGLLSSTTGT